ncbi:MAG: methionine--tRNA ligase [Nitrospirae bacterium]|nr:methionine--tRNA ligase [Nitrospirota bacterium]
MAKFFVTTPIYYVNDVPHIGHAYTTVAADILARYHRMIGDDVFFLTGTDEHGKKVEHAAAKQGKNARHLADDVHVRFKELWKTLNISNDHFIRTTDMEHYHAVAEFWDRARKNGDIFLGDYEGWYCTPCETFWTEKELVLAGTLQSGGISPTTGAMIAEPQEPILLCPTCKRRTEKLKQPSYFFKLGKYRSWLLDYFKNNPGSILPESRRNEVLGFLQSEELKDLSISRTDFSWGIPVPGDPKHVIYVWFDALINYLTASHYTPGRESSWPASVHLVGKDILRFHTVYWFAFLKSAGFPPPQSVFAHGWWTIDGQKMSKSLGNVIDPFEVTAKYGVDPFRYFLFREVPFGQDGNYSNRLLEARLNGDLANDLGNLLSRVVSVAVQHFPAGTIRGPLNHNPAALGELGTQLLVKRERMRKKWQEALQTLNLQGALEATWELLREANGYVDRTRPWELKGKESGTPVLIELLETLRHVAIFIQPFMPHTSQAIGQQIAGRDFFDAASRPADSAFSNLESKYPLENGCKIEKGKHLVERIDLLPEKPKENKVEATDNLLGIEEFQKIELRSGVILSAEEVPNSKRLIKLQVDLGNEQRQVVAGIKHVYTAADVVGKKVVVVTNLKPAKIMGVESQGMVLAASEGDALTLVSFDREVKPGWKVK